MSRLPATAAASRRSPRAGTRSSRPTAAATTSGSGPSAPPPPASLRAKKAATLPANGRLSVLCFGKKRPPHHHRDTVSCLVLHAAAGLLYTASHDSTVKAWKLSDGACTDSFAAHDGPINAMVVNEADGCVFTGSSDGTVKMWRRVPGCGAAHALVVVLRSGPEAPSCPR